MLRIAKDKKLTNVSSLNQNTIFGSLFIILSILAILPLLFGKENVYIQIWDHLDSGVVILKVLAESNQLFSSSETVIDNIMGLPRFTYGSEFNAIVWLIKIFGTYYALLINEIVIRVIGFIGMYLLVSRYIIGPEIPYSKIIASSIALLFSIVPHWPLGGISVAGQPLLTYALLNLMQKDSIKSNWIIIVLYPFYSSFMVFGIFYLITFGVFYIYKSISNKRIYYNTFFALLILTLLFLIIEYRQILNLINPLFVSHRIEFNTYALTNIHSYTDIFSLLKQTFLHGHAHAPTLHYYIILPLTIFSFVVALIYKDFKTVTYIGGLIILAIVFNVIYVLSLWSGTERFIGSINFLKQFNYTRFITLLPLLWYCLIAFSVNTILKYRFAASYYVLLSLFIVQYYLITKETYFIKPYIDSWLYNNHDSNKLTYNDFFSEDLFTEIKTYLDSQTKTGFKVAGLGIYPSILQYNNFSTLDGYVNIYPLSYKHDFRKIISQELINNEANKKYFDNWGNRCYIFDDIIGQDYLCTKNRNKQTEVLEINVNAFSSLNGKYILSAVEIKNPEITGLSLLKTFENNVWKIFVYTI